MNRRSSRVEREIESAQARRREEASRWYVLIQHTELTPHMLRAWKKWAALPGNREEFDLVVSFWKQPNVPLHHPEPGMHERISDEYDGSIPVQSWLMRNNAFRRRVVAWTAFAAAILATVGSLQWAGSRHFGVPPDEGYVSAETGVAEHRELALADGTRIHLGAQSLVTAQLTERGRSVVLHRGEALFNVAHDQGRPFRVNAGKGDITAVGTKFNVLRRDDHVIVTVTEGIVDVASRSIPTEDMKGARHASTTATVEPAAVRRLTRGQEIGFDPQGHFSPIRLTEASTAVSWREGRLIYRSEPLRNVLQDVNRYSQRQIIVGDADAGDLLYSGTAFEGNIDDWIAALERLYPELEVVDDNDRHVLIRTREP